MKAVVVDSKITDLFTNFDIEKRFFEKENIDLAVENIKHRKICRAVVRMLMHCC